MPQEHVVKTEFNGQQYQLTAYCTVRAPAAAQNVYAVEVENLADAPPRLYERREFLGECTLSQVIDRVAGMAGALETRRAYARGALPPQAPRRTGTPGRGLNPQ